MNNHTLATATLAYVCSYCEGVINWQYVCCLHVFSGTKKMLHVQYAEMLFSKLCSTYTNNIQGVVTHFSDLCILVVHQIYQIGWSLWIKLLRKRFLQGSGRKNQEAASIQLITQDGQDTGLFDDDISRSLVKNHLIKNVHNLTNKLIVFLLSWKTQNTID